nr:hypothetical protein [Kibdelosporangium sp. MJ126-NF4]
MASRRSLRVDRLGRVTDGMVTSYCPDTLAGHIIWTYCPDVVS